MGAPGDASESLASLLSKNTVSEEVRQKVRGAGFTCLLSFPHALQQTELASWFLVGTAFCSSAEKFGRFDLTQEPLGPWRRRKSPPAPSGPGSHGGARSPWLPGPICLPPKGLPLFTQVAPLGVRPALHPPGPGCDTFTPRLGGSEPRNLLSAPFPGLRLTTRQPSSGASGTPHSGCCPPRYPGSQPVVWGTFPTHLSFCSPLRSHLLSRRELSGPRPPISTFSGKVQRSRPLLPSFLLCSFLWRDQGSPLPRRCSRRVRSRRRPRRLRPVPSRLRSPRRPRALRRRRPARKALPLRRLRST